MIIWLRAKSGRSRLELPVVMSAPELEQSLSEDGVITSGSTWAAIWHMSWPMVLYMSTISLANFTEVWVAGKLGSDAQAAVGICGQIWFSLVLLTIALASGTTALVSRFWGARDTKAAIEAARQSLYFSIVFGTITVVTGLIFCRTLLKFLGASAQVEELGWNYLRFDLLAQIPMTVFWISNAISRAKGNARLPMTTWVLASLMVVILDVTLCLWPFQLGVSGLGIAWLLAATTGMVISLLFLSKSEIGKCVDLPGLFSGGISWTWFMRIMKIGFPACIQDMAWLSGNLGLLLVLSRGIDPTSGQASWAVGLRVEEILSSMPLCALSMSIATIVGQNLGASQADRAKLAGWQTAGVGAAFSAVVGLAMLVFARQIAQLMSSNQIVIQYASQYFQIVGLSEPFVALELVLFGAMQGAGYTRWPMLATVFCFTILRLPLAFLLAEYLKLGPAGAWLSVAISSVIVGLLAAWRFAGGIWQQQKV